MQNSDLVFATLHVHGPAGGLDVNPASGMDSGVHRQHPPGVGDLTGAVLAAIRR